MDSCIEELALVISERARTGAENENPELSDGFAIIAANASQIIKVIRDYRQKHPEIYADSSQRELHILRGMAETFKAELISARQELAGYKERERVWGWDKT